MGKLTGGGSRAIWKLDDGLTGWYSDDDVNIRIAGCNKSYTATTYLSAVLRTGDISARSRLIRQAGEVRLVSTHAITGKVLRQPEAQLSAYRSAARRATGCFGVYWYFGVS